MYVRIDIKYVKRLMILFESFELNVLLIQMNIMQIFVLINRIIKPHHVFATIITILNISI